MTTARILIADSSSLAAAGAETVLRAREGMMIDKAAHIDDLMKRMVPAPDIVLLADPFDPLVDTFQLLERLRARVPRTRLVLTGAYASGRLIRELLLSGIHAYLIAGDDLIFHLPSAVESVLKGRYYLSPTANSEYLVSMHGRGRYWEPDHEGRSVLRMLAQGYTVGQIAFTLRCTQRHIYWIREKLRGRFGATTNEQMIYRAVEEGFARVTG